MRHAHANTYSDSNTHTNADPYSHPNTHTDANAHSDTYPDSDSGLRGLCGRHQLCVESGGDERRRLLPMYRSRLVFFDSGLVLRTRHRFGMDSGLDSSDFGFLRHAYTYSYPNADADSHTDADSYPNADSYSDANPDTQPVA